MMREIGVPYANSFLEHTVRTYQLSEEDIMQMYSAIYAISGNAKAEKGFTGILFVHGWSRIRTGI